MQTVSLLKLLNEFYPSTHSLDREAHGSCGFFPLIHSERRRKLECKSLLVLVWQRRACGSIVRILIRLVVHVKTSVTALFSLLLFLVVLL